MVIYHRSSINIILILLCFIISIDLSAQSILFNHLTVEDGLSNNDVNAIAQDKTGFIWFGTDDGLNRYDGYSFKIFRHDPDDSNSISDNSIWTLYEDSQGNIWIGTKAGVLNKYNPVSGQFTHWEIESDITEENSITAIYEDGKGKIWIGTYKDGLYRLHPVSGKLDHWSADPGNAKSMSHNYVQDICEDNNGNMLIGTYIGLCKFNPALPENGFECFYYDPENQNSLSNNLIWALSKSSTDPNIIWIGTADKLTKLNTADFTFDRIEIVNPENLQYGTSSGSVIEEVKAGEKIIWTDSYSGLVRLNITSGSTRRFVHDDNNPRSLINNRINKIIKDRTGVLWVATENGISYNTPKSTLFNSPVFNNSDIDISSELKKKNITAITESDENRIWIGTADGLYLLKNIGNNPQLGRIYKFDGYHIWSLTTRNENELWIGTYGKGLKEFNYQTNQITDRNINHPEVKTLSLYYNKSLLTDSRNNIWVGYWGIGASRINTVTGNSDIWMNDPENPKSISHNDVWVIEEDRFGRVWLGTAGGGLNLFEDKDGGIFHHWIQTAHSKNSLSSNDIFSICESKKLNNPDTEETVLWLGTDNGLNRFEIRNNKGIANVYDIDVNIEIYGVKDGLPDNSVNSIVEDDNGNLWLGTNTGISFFDVSKKTFTNFSRADGINGSLMNPESALSLDNGPILFGSSKGLNVFYPENIQLSSYKPNLVITDFQIFNKSVKIRKNSPLKESIVSTDKIILSHNEDVISIEFAALDYNSPPSIQYAYKMDGFDKDWIYSGTRRFVTYTNLDPGEYKFKVKSTNADGIWNDSVTSLSVIMNPPWWKTFWAYGLYMILIFLGLFTIRRFELNRTKLRNELKLREFEVRQKSELEELKSRFFANLSHEFRTPLMLIKGPLEQLKAGGINNNYTENIDLIERNSSRLKELIDQLLELSQLENASIPLRAKRENIIIILKGLVSSFESLANQKNIHLKIESESDSLICWIDRDKFEKVINNLLSNAFKFTPENGRVIVGVKQSMLDDKQVAEISISDSGVSIPKDKLDKIFDRFFQVDDSSKRSYGGSGVGLALVKEFVDLHKWDISVESEPGKGTEFRIKIPMRDDYLDEDEKVAGETSEKSMSTGAYKSEGEQFVQSISDAEGQPDRDNLNDKPQILIVDDSEDVRKYLTGLLENRYTISESANGEEGIKAAAETVPDLIISDIMMPEMDGIEFCRRIKSEWQTSDIPVILLTAKASSESKIEGLETGADDYLTKPFDSRELFTRIKNLLEQRKRLREKYSKDPDALTKTGNLVTADKDFLQKALEIVDKNLAETSFGTEQLAKELFVSRTQLYRKMLDITGQGPGVFIRAIKLKRAAKLLMEGKLSVTQIAYEIGFSSPAQFTRAFTKQYNCVPSEYTGRNK
jgi:signal transduction histidine kinase/ligand-binding sensor domain-containing protein/DNA-binding response OmpR family regulator